MCFNLNIRLFDVVCYFCACSRKGMEYVRLQRRRDVPSWRRARRGTGGGRTAERVREETDFWRLMGTLVH